MVPCSRDGVIWGDGVPLADTDHPWERMDFVESGRDQRLVKVGGGTSGVISGGTLDDGYQSTNHP